MKPLHTKLVVLPPLGLAAFALVCRSPQPGGSTSPPEPGPKAESRFTPEERKQITEDKP